jgi:diguanylate cyclase (GGDEF)-like protein
VATLISGLVREGDLVTRLGGDEFCALLQGANTNAAEAVARRIVEAIAALNDSAVTISVGVACGPATGIVALLRAADSAMYIAKRAGGNRTQRHLPAA